MMLYCKLWLHHVNKAFFQKKVGHKNKLISKILQFHNSDTQKVYEISCKRKPNFDGHFRLKTLHNVDTLVDMLGRQKNCRD